MRVVIVVVAIAAGIFFFLRHTTTEGGAMQPPVSPSSTFLLSDQELQKQKDLGTKGDCEAAFRVSHHYSFVLNDFDQALPWLRIAARCPNGNAKAELVYLLLGPKDKGEVAQEIDRLVLELEKVDPSQAQAVKKEVEMRRAGKP